MFALMRKEFRAISRLIALALLADGLLLSDLTGQSYWLHSSASQSGFFLVQSDWLLRFGFLVAGIASMLGLAMSMDDGLRGTWQFALFRPASRRAYIGVKLLVGGAMTLALSVFPVLVYSIWAARPGNVAAPFRLSLLQPAIEACGWSVVVFLGAFLSGIRPAKWWWSRLWPLATSVVLGILIWLVPWEPDVPRALTATVTEYWCLCVGMVIVLSVSILAVVEEREFA